MKRLKKWFGQAPHQPTSDYGDRILRAVLTTRMVESKVHTLLLMVLTLIVRFVISIVGKSFLYFENSRVLTFITAVAFSVVLVFASDTLYGVLAKYRDELAPLTHHICNHWDDAHLKVWKRNTMLFLSALILLYAAVVDITSAKIVQWTFEYVLCYFIVEGIQHRGEWAERVHCWFYRPKVRQFVAMPNVLLDESYRHEDTSSPPPPPPTPPPQTPTESADTESINLTQSMPPWSRKKIQLQIIDDYFAT